MYEILQISQSLEYHPYQRISYIIHHLYFINMNDTPDYRQSAQGDNSRHRVEKDEGKRYKYCCRKCKHTQKGKKSCVCVVPLTQRRTNLNEEGCQGCGCKGCSIEDYISRGEDPEYRPRSEKKQEKGGKNYCCRKCRKSKKGKRCACHLPKNRRKGLLPSGGCKNCGCEGCNDNEYSDSSSSSRSRSRSRESSSVNQYFDEAEYNFNNFDKSVLGKVIAVEYNTNPLLLGMGVPQRTPSYILGKPI